MNMILIEINKEIENLTEEDYQFPKYTTQLLNLANQNAQGTRRNIVGQMSDLIQECPEKSFEKWRTWYLESHPDAIDNATKKVFSMIQNMRDAIEMIDEEMTHKWITDLVITKTAKGLILQEIILKAIAKMQGKEYRLATSKEESKNIDGFIGEDPVQIKPLSYLSKKATVREHQTAELIFYKETTKYLRIYTERDIDKTQQKLY